ncbi:MAG: nickel-dependent lactate racemase [Chloroflexota bacterium]|jgi:nickel-dependent lactate racemase|tara:strand:+ start:12282 stop:13556 length:1275 start_codon:yes stop_codon:yes gene_type:complete
MLVKLAYGDSGLKVEFPDLITDVVEPEYVPGLPDEPAAIQSALRNPINSNTLRQLVSKNQKVAISICDITRPSPTDVMLPHILKELSHIPAQNVSILVATGTHRANSTDELIAMLGHDIVNNYTIINHDCFNRNTLNLTGETSDGTPIWLNKIWVEADVRITCGFVEPHFFAGFSGGPKMVAPGLAGFDTIMALHNAKRIGSSKSVWGITHGNPVHDTVREIAKLTGVDFSVDVTINKNREITSVFAGNLFEAHKAACETSKRIVMRGVEREYDIVVTTNSGYPLDQNLYQTVKGLSAAAQVVKNGGTIICASECRDGLPSHGEYSKILSESNSISTLLEAINQSENTRHDQWQVQVQARIQMRAEVLIKSDFLTDEQIRAAHFNPISNIESALEKSINKHGKSARICVLPEGPQTIPYLSKHI